MIHLIQSFLKKWKQRVLDQGLENSGFEDQLSLCRIDCPLSNGNQAATPKIERLNGKNTKSNFFS